MAITVNETKRGSFVTSISAFASCDLADCSWIGETRQMRATAERDLADHTREEHLKGLF